MRGAGQCEIPRWNSVPGSAPNPHSLCYVLIHLPAPLSRHWKLSGVCQGQVLANTTQIPVGSKVELALTPTRTDRGAPPQPSLPPPRTQERSPADLSVCLEHQCLPKQIARKAPQIAGGPVNWEEGREPPSKTQAGSTKGREEHG